MKKIVLFALVSVSFSGILFASNIINKNGVRYFSDRIVIKFKDDTGFGIFNKASLPDKLKKHLSNFGAEEIIRKFNPQKKYADELNKIYEVKILQSFDPMLVAEKLSKFGEIEWAEPKFIDELFFTPNDPLFSSQYSLSIINAQEAWDINQGDPSIVIGIVDTGVDWDHPDLAANIWINETELNGVPGVDDDNNGYIDDVRGWDFGGLSGTPDNNPMEDRPDHGTHVAGIAGAVTNNNEGVASIGFNTRIMAVKTSQDNIRTSNNIALIAYGYEGIIYAVDNGAKVVNCSWGSFSYSNANQAVIDYAVANGALVVGAAGNNGTNSVIYPGNYDGALSVGYSNSGDKRDVSSNYGTDVDLFAPGSLIYNTWQNNTYATLSGSSMASPLVAGLAALVFAQFPSYSPLQAAEQVRSNTDNIDDQNRGLEFLLGSGRINAYKTLSNNNAKSVRVSSFTITEAGDGDGIFESGEGGTIEADFINYLNPLSNLSVELISNSNYVSIEQGAYNAGSAGTLASFNNSSNPFRFSINSSTPLNTEVTFRLTFTDDGYSSFQWLKSIIINPVYKTQNINDVALTITSNGALGFNDYSSNLQGDGFTFQSGPNLLFEGGLIYGTSSGKIMSAVRGSNAEFQSNSFKMIKPFTTEIPGAKADEQGHAVFNDDNAFSNKLGIETNIYSYSYADIENNNYIILRYIFKNNSESAISNFYAGLFFDWDIDETDYADNLVSYDSDGGFGFAYNSDGNPVDAKIAMALVSEGNYGFYGIHNNGDDGGVGVYDGFTDSEKWITLTSALTKPNAGAYDVSCVVSGGPFSIPAGDAFEAAFVIAASSTMDALRTAVINAKDKYQNIITGIEENELNFPFEFYLAQNYPNPFNPSTKIIYSIPAVSGNFHPIQLVILKVYDILGREVATLVNEPKAPGNYEINFNAEGFSSGIYLYKLQAGGLTSVRKLLLLK